MQKLPESGNKVSQTLRTLIRFTLSLKNYLTSDEREK